MSVAERFVAVDGLRTRYLEDGQGEVVLLLHGASLGSSADVWTRNLPDFAARGFRAIAPDLPGFGLSDDPRDASLAYRTAFVPLFLDELGIDRAFLIGHSQSGRIGVALAAADPRRFPKIVVLGTASLLPALPEAPKESEGDEGAEREPSIAETRAALESNLFDRTLATDAEVALRQRMSAGRNFEAFRRRQETKARGGAKLAEVAVPVRLIYGRQDRSAAARAALLPPTADIHLLDRAGHLVQWDAQEVFARLASEFLAAPKAA